METSFRIQIRRACFACAAVLFAGCSSQVGVLEEHEQLWAKAHPSAYAYTYRSGGSMPNVEFRVTVRDGVVTETTALAPQGVSEKGEPIEKLFDHVRAELAGSGCDVSADYDEQLGFPKSIAVDCGSESYGWDVIDFTGIS